MHGYRRGGIISSTINGHEAISARFFLTSAFLTMTIFMMSLQNEMALSVRDEKSFGLPDVFDGDVHEPRTHGGLLGHGRFGLVHDPVLPVRPLN
jgi:hypothetical protein